MKYRNARNGSPRKQNRKLKKEESLQDREISRAICKDEKQKILQSIEQDESMKVIRRRLQND